MNLLMNIYRQLNLQRATSIGFYDIYVYLFIYSFTSIVYRILSFRMSYWSAEFELITFNLDYIKTNYKDQYCIFTFHTKPIQKIKSLSSIVLICKQFYIGHTSSRELLAISDMAVHSVNIGVQAKRDKWFLNKTN